MSDERTNWASIREAIEEHKRISQQVKINANTLADLLEDSLEHVNTYRLRRLKAKLRRFNMTTGEWQP